MHILIYQYQYQLYQILNHITYLLPTHESHKYKITLDNLTQNVNTKVALLHQ